MALRGAIHSGERRSVRPPKGKGPREERPKLSGNRTEGRVENRSKGCFFIHVSAGWTMTQLQKTTLHPLHAEAGARLIDFGGWEMPVQYRSQVEEHHAVRRTAGIFDVGHMRAVDVEGDDAEAFLRGLLANDVAKLDDGRALYSCMLNARGGVKDDLIIYRRGAGRYRAVLNAATAMADIDWMAEHISGDCRINLRDDRTIVALQGPKATELLPKLVDAALADAAVALKPFRCTEAGDVFIGRTGYTGEDGFEVVLPVDAAADFWRAAVDAGAEPCGLGARDTLRLEAGMNLYGQDMDEDTFPAEAGLSWTVALEPGDRDFVGRAALEAADPQRRLIGFVLEGRGVMRGHMAVRFANGATGETTSGSHSPTMGASIALARVEGHAEGDAEVCIRDRWLPARVVKPPFVRNGQVRV